MLLNLFGEYLMKEVLAEVRDFKFEGRIINKVKFSDDTVIIAKIQEELQDTVKILVDNGSMTWKPTSTNHRRWRYT